MKRLLLLLITFSTLYSADIPIVVDLTTSKLSTIEKRLLKGIPHTANYYSAQGQSIDIVVVIHGGAYKFFVNTLSDSPYKNDQELKQNQAALKKKLDMFIKKYPVRFEVCSQGMKRNNIQKESLYDFVHPIPSAMIGLTGLQKKGYVYLPID